jgi:hypothetical protein
MKKYFSIHEIMLHVPYGCASHTRQGTNTIFFMINKTFKEHLNINNYGVINGYIS